MSGRRTSPRTTGIGVICGCRERCVARRGVGWYESPTIHRDTRIVYKILPTRGTSLFVASIVVLIELNALDPPLSPALTASGPFLPPRHFKSPRRN